MCTAITFKTENNYFGRTLDYEISYGERIVITPRDFKLEFRKTFDIEHHYAMIGMAAVANDYPLYFDAMNEKGVCMAGLNFPDNAKYYEEKNMVNNIAPFEFIPWILAQCKNIGEVKRLLNKTNIVNLNFSSDLPLSPLHWIIAHNNESITVETTKDGMKIFDNPIGVLTNNPTFDMQLFNLNNYINLSPGEQNNRFSDNIKLSPYSRGMGALGLPGDVSSASRFVRAAFVKLNSVCGITEFESVSQFFHILASVVQIRGCVKLKDSSYEITRYTSCCNADKGIYYFTTYENSRICAVSLNQAELNSNVLHEYELPKQQDISYR